MKVYAEKINDVFNYFNTSEKGLNDSQVIKSSQKYGKNIITKQKGKTFIKKIIDALLDPMLIILELATVITLGVNIGKSLKGQSADFFECFGIVFAIFISVFLTIYMEGKSQKAFEILNNMYESTLVKVLRNGKTTLISQKDIVVGDIVFFDSGDKIIADCRIVKSNSLLVSEASLTGESQPVKKYDDIVLYSKTPLLERKNMLFSGCYVVEGSCTAVVTAVGDNAEIGSIAKELQVKNSVSAPLQEKLDRLGKFITALGGIASVFVLILTVAKLYAKNNVSFDTIENAFINSIVLIVASVPEGLPTTVAIALTLNVVKLSSSNALIKKLVATETVGCVSVICSDKTGTLTENKMKVQKVNSVSGNLDNNLIYNIAINSTANLSEKNGEIMYIGNVTESSLLYHLKCQKIDYLPIREKAKIVEVEPFNSKNKFMQTKIILDGKEVTYLKGAIEIVLKKCQIDEEEKSKILKSVSYYENKAMRVISFAHKIDDNAYVYDGFIAISDSIRKDVYSAVKECKRAGIKVKILTGDSFNTAYQIAKQLDIAKSTVSVTDSTEIDNLTDGELKEKLQDITVVARSTPKTKLRIVKLLKEMGEVVACTGDGINDAPAIKHADIGISMGSGDEITKEASDIVLLDNSFSTIVKAISFGRNIYANFQRFIMFQLSVNLTAVVFIVVSIIFDMGNPFNTLQLLWINVIMDGPPALTLGLESHNKDLMNLKPVKRSDNIVSKNMLLRIGFHAFITTLLLTLQYKYNYIGCSENQMSTVLFSLFILFQLFNAFNCRELGSISVFKNLSGNKPMLIVFTITFVMQIIISEFLGAFFKTQNLDVICWIKIIFVAFSVILLSEIYKFLYRLFTGRESLSKNYKNMLIKNKNNA